MTVFLRLAVILIALAGAARGMAAESPIGPLERFVLQGSEEGWEGTLSADVYRLENRNSQTEGDTRYFFVEPRRDESRYWTTAVKVKVQPASGGESPSFAGIICAVQSQPRSYLAFTIDSAGRLVVLRRDAKGLRPVWINTENPRDPGAFNELRIVEGDGQYQVFIDGQRIRTLHVNISVEGGVGIIANGRGGFLFRDFAITPNQ